MGTGNIGHDNNLPGNVIYITKNISATEITTTGIDVTGTASDRLSLKYAVIRTDGVALGPTTSNSVILSSNQTLGASEVLSSTVGGLGASASVEKTTPYILNATGKLSIRASNSALTSTGNVTVDLVFEKLKNGANILVAS